MMMRKAIEKTLHTFPLKSLSCDLVLVGYLIKTKIL